VMNEELDRLRKENDTLRHERRQQESQWKEFIAKKINELIDSQQETKDSQASYHLTTTQTLTATTRTLEALTKQVSGLHVAISGPLEEPQKGLISRVDSLEQAHSQNSKFSAKLFWIVTGGVILAGIEWVKSKVTKP